MWYTEYGNWPISMQLHKYNHGDNGSLVALQVPPVLVILKDQVTLHLLFICFGPSSLLKHGVEVVASESIKEEYARNGLHVCIRDYGIGLKWKGIGTSDDFYLVPCKISLPNITSKRKLK